SFRVPILITTVGSRQLPVDVNDHSGFARTRAVGIARKYTRTGSRNHASLIGGKESEGNLPVPVLCLKANRVARQGIEQRSPQRSRGNGQKFTAFHAAPLECLACCAINASAAR